MLCVISQRTVGDAGPYNAPFQFTTVVAGFHASPLRTESMLSYGHDMGS